MASPSAGTVLWASVSRAVSPWRREFSDGRQRLRGYMYWYLFNGE